MYRGSRCRIQDLVIFMDKVFEFQGLQFEWDEDKNASNQRKHGVKFEEGAEVFFDAASVFDDASVGGERRDSVIGFSLSARVLLVVFIERGERTRIISARRATAQERNDYEKNS